jgi:hypothetical protein
VKDRNDEITRLVDLSGFVKNNAEVSTSQSQRIASAYIQTKRRERMSRINKLQRGMFVFAMSALCTILYVYTSSISHHATISTTSPFLVLAEIDATRLSLAQNDTTHRMTTDFLKRHIAKLKQQTQQWEAKYEVDNQGISEKLAEMQKVYSRDRALLENLRSRLYHEQEEKTLAARKAYLEQIAAEKRARLERTVYIAQCCIRFHWRVFKRKREANLALLKKKKKKGKGKKKKKGKK